MEQQIIRIGTRDSKLAMWQAKEVQSKIEALGHKTTLVPVKSVGDTDQNTPLHQFGSTGIFTKILDDALLKNTVDIAVHSLKDYPTIAPQGIKLPSVLERGSHQDVIALKNEDTFLNNSQSEALIATGSIRRIAQWKHKFPKHKMTNLRGNVQTRMNKLENSNWQGAIFAKAGLERVNLLPKNYKVLDWMIPAPAQGVVGIACREKDKALEQILLKINNPNTFLCSKIERDFLNTVEGGCSAPVGAFAKIENAKVIFTGAVFSLNGKQKMDIEKTAILEKATNLGQQAAKEILQKGGKEIMDTVKNG